MAINRNLLRIAAGIVSVGITLLALSTTNLLILLLCAALLGGILIPALFGKTRLFRAAANYRAALPTLLVVIVLLLGTPVLAQGTSVNPSVSLPSLPPFDFNTLVQQFMVFCLGLIGAFISSPATTAIVAWLKRLPVLQKYDSQTLAVMTGAILAVLLALAAHFGVEGQFRTVVDIITAILTTLGSMSINLFSAATLYNAAKAQGVPMIGYSRSKAAQKALHITEIAKPPSVAG